MKIVTVKIVKASHSRRWYSSVIGQILTNVCKTEDEKYFICDAFTNYSKCFISNEDLEEVKRPLDSENFRSSIYKTKAACFHH